ncbi:MAG: hypothetical protein ABIR94_23845 [Rubrivivax sp.]
MPLLRHKSHHGDRIVRWSVQVGARELCLERRAAAAQCHGKLIKRLLRDT